MASTAENSFTRFMCSLLFLKLHDALLLLLLDKEEAINIQFLMQSRSRFCQNCNAVIDRGMKMKPELSVQEQVAE